MLSTTFKDICVDKLDMTYIPLRAPFSKVASKTQVF